MSNEESVMDQFVEELKEFQDTLSVVQDKLEAVKLASDKLKDDLAQSECHQPNVLLEEVPKS